MNQPKIPPHPLGFRCADCKFWNASLAHEVAITPQGPIPTMSMTAEQRLSVARMPKMKTAPCQWGPQWSMQAEDAYCWQFVKVLTIKGKLETVLGPTENIGSTS